jgi:serine/threonine-protein kinase
VTGTQPTTLGGRYRLIAPIAAGGMSVVWRGYDDVLARPVAVKLLAGLADNVDTERVRREAMAVARISHPYIANVYDYGDSPDPYIVMELVEGDSLAQILTRGPLSWPTAAGSCAQVAAALSAAHQHGVVHRDVTPSNIMLCVDGVKVVDFGISVPAGQEADAQIFGTPAYLAPERLSGGPALPATDVYGLGLVLYQMITGTLPWPSETTTQMLNAHRYVPPAAMPAIPGLPDDLIILTARALAVEPSDRPAATDMCTKLSALARSGDPRVKPALAGTVPTAAESGQRGPTGTRVLPHGATALIDPSASTVLGPVAASAKVASKPRDRRMFVLPAVLLAVLVIGLAWASLHQAPTTVTAPAPSPSAAVPRHVVPAPTKAASSDACHVDYQMLSQWVIGFTAQVTIINTGTEEIGGWTLRFQLQPGQKVGGGWNGRWNQDGSTVTVTDAGYNQDVPIGGQVTLGFLGSQPGNTSSNPTRFTLNGTACS